MIGRRGAGGGLLAGAALVEGAAASARFRSREVVFAAAVERARITGRVLVVVGDPHGGGHTRLVPAYGCGEVCVDLTGCPACPVGVAVDITRGRVESVETDSAVVFCSCVLEYVSDPAAALAELRRMAGARSNFFLVVVQRWTATAALYPGARWCVTVADDRVSWRPVSRFRKVGTVAALVALGAVAAGAAGS